MSLNSDGSERNPYELTDKNRVEWKHLEISDKMTWMERGIKTPKMQTRTESTVTCGNPKKVKELKHNFSQTSSLHGAIYLCSSKNSTKCMRRGYTVLILLCFLAVIYAIFSLLRDSRSRESTIINTMNKDFDIGLEEDPDRFPKYPQVTICRKPSFKMDTNESFMPIFEYASLSLGYPFASLNPREVTMIIEIAKLGLDTTELEDPQTEEYRKHLIKLDSRYQNLKASEKNFNLTQFLIDNSIRCENFFNSCVALVYSFECCEVFKPILTSLGLCYTMKRNYILDENLNQNIGFTFVIDLVTPPHIDRALDQGFHVYFSDPSGDFYVAEMYEGEKALPDMVTVINVQLEKWNRYALHATWHGLWDECPIFPFAEEANLSDAKRYTSRMCGAYFIFQKHRVACDCESVLYMKKSTLKQCDPKDVYICLTGTVLKNNLSDLIRTCTNPCIYYKYKTEASYMGFGAKNQSRVEIIYDSTSFTYHQYRTSTFSGFISQIGGSLGLYLGASIITVVELVVFTLSWLWYKVFPEKQSKVHHIPPSTIQGTSSTIRNTKRAIVYR